MKLRQRIAFYVACAVLVLFMLLPGTVVILSSVIMYMMARYISPTFSLLPVALHMFHWVKLVWSGVVFLLFGIRVRRVGDFPFLEPGKPMLIAGTHGDIIDPPVIAWTIGRKIINNWIVKAGIHGLGPILKAAGCLVTNRQGSKSEAATLFEGQDELMKRYGCTLVSFASGSRSKDEFKAGSFRFALEAGFPIVIFAISYSLKLNVLKRQGGIVYVSMSLLDGYEDCDAEEVAKLARKRADTMLDAHPSENRR